MTARADSSLRMAFLHLLVAVLPVCAGSSAMSGLSVAAELSADAMLGYSAGPGGQAGLTLARFVPESPLRARLGIGYASVAPGKAGEAREIFINDADDGTPEKSGHVWTYRFDFLFPVGRGPERHWFVYGGPRHSRFTASFKYVGGNEDFDVRARQWGFGGGIETSVPMSARTELRLSGGADYFPKTALEGHDTTYAPDGEHVNPRKDFTYADADRAVNQPEVIVRLLAGVSLALGR